MMMRARRLRATPVQGRSGRSWRQVSAGTRGGVRRAGGAVGSIAGGCGASTVGSVAVSVDTVMTAVRPRPSTGDPHAAILLRPNHRKTTAAAHRKCDFLRISVRLGQEFCNYPHD